MKRYATLAVLSLLVCSSGVPAKPKGCAQAHVTERQGLAFGRLGVFAAGTATVSPLGGLTTSGGVTGIPGGTVSAGTYDITGCPNTVFTIVMPASMQLKAKGSSVTLDRFTSSPSGTGIFDGSGYAMVSVGATLNAAANQASGDYSGRFTIEVVY